MSVILKKENGDIILYCKGADSIIKGLLCEESLNGAVMRKTSKYVNEYAREGLRTLFCAEKKIDHTFYDSWKPKADAAKNVVKDREEEVGRVDALIETELRLIGSTAIEDRLQDKVADTI